jgi:hypothetical protein
MVLEGLKPLAKVVAASNQDAAEDDYSIAAQIARRVAPVMHPVYGNKC